MATHTLNAKKSLTRQRQNSLSENIQYKHSKLIQNTSQEVTIFEFILLCIACYVAAAVILPHLPGGH